MVWPPRLGHRRHCGFFLALPHTACSGGSQQATMSGGHDCSLWTGSPREEVRPSTKQQGSGASYPQPCESAILETEPSAPFQPSGDGSPATIFWTTTLRRNLEPEPLSQATPKFLTRRNHEIIFKTVKLCYTKVYD